MQSKTFRLFISSTFSDFNEERRLLQTYVFPEIKKYSSDLGEYTFQPIDLRWGVSNEAQLDQKTLELCIDEVHASKLQPYPNFLIMAGDRYGWVPLTYAIEEEEFKAIKKQVKATDEPLTIEYKEYKVKDSNACETGDKGSFGEIDNNKIFKPNDSQTTKIELLEKWYELDENQIPSSYILQERVNNEHGCYESYQYWEAEENALREIIQTAVSESDLSDEIKYKYFDSATEQETVDGILNYKGLTKFQESELDGDNKAVQLKDKSNVYGYIRTIDESNSDPESISSFIVDDEDRVKANEFKDKIRDSIGAGNILEVKEASIGNFCKVGEDDKVDSGNCKTRGLNYEYDAIGSKAVTNSEKDSKFVKKMCNFLKRSINSFHSKYNKQNATELDEQIESQKLFKQTKSKGFVGREDDLQAIQDYISGDSDKYNNEQALVIYGPSGMGKSALMAKAIEQTEDDHKDKKVVYRFVGSKADLSTSIGVVLSILNELGIEESVRTIKNIHGEDELEITSIFFKRVSLHLSKVNEDVVIFIDAVDQFTNKDELFNSSEFKWLPYELPDNVNIIISALKDDKYKDDSRYLKLLKTDLNNQNNLHKVKPLSDSQSQAMLRGILASYSRAISNDQESYVFSQDDAKQPLYLYIAAQELIHWKISDITKDYKGQGGGQDLAPTQREVIDEYIRNLKQMYHHDEELVHRVFSYLYLCDGLSETELLNILSADNKFINRIAPDTYHVNTMQNLPVAIWARLHSHIKPFLKLENKDGQDVMNFFHREFVSETGYPELYTSLLLENIKNKIKKNKWPHRPVGNFNLYEHKLTPEGKEEEKNKYVNFLGTHKKLINLITKMIQIYAKEGIDDSRYQKLWLFTMKDYIKKVSIINNPPLQNLNDFNVSNIKDFSNLFADSQFNGDISKWDTSSVLSMNRTFFRSQFSGDISKWNTSSVLSMNMTFFKSQFNGDISKWNTSNVEKMGGLFRESIFNGDISKWDTSSVNNMSGLLLQNSYFNQDISRWDVSKVENMLNMFRESQFNGNISKWDTSNVENMWGMFCGSKFNQDISKWDVSNVTDMSEMFYGSQFDQNISRWDVSKVESTLDMFKRSPFNQDISKWNVSKVEQMHGMFQDSLFNQDISDWEINAGDMPAYAESVFKGPLEIGEYSKKFTARIERKTGNEYDLRTFFYKKGVLIRRLISTYKRDKIVSAISSENGGVLHGKKGDIETYTEFYKSSEDEFIPDDKRIGGYKRHGQSIWWYENGQKEGEINYADDKQEGLTTWWYENGQKQSEGNYKDDKAEGLTKWWHDDGSKYGEINSKNGERHGARTIWDKEGNVIFSATYNNGSSNNQNGLEPQYDDEGGLTHYIEYKDGVVVNERVEPD